MKRPVVALAIIILAATLPACVPGRAQSTLVPHEDPASAESLTERVFFFLMDFLDLKVLHPSITVEGLAKLIEDGEYGDIAGDITHIVESLQGAASDTMERLDNIEKELSLASLLLVQLQVDDAIQVLNRARGPIRKQEMVLQDLDETAQELEKLWEQVKPLADRWGVDTALVQTRVQELDDVLRQMQDEQDELKRKHETLEHSFNEMLNKTEVRVTAPDEVYPGELVVVQGDVVSAGGVLPGVRKVELLLDGTPLKEKRLETDTKGHFEVEVQLDPETSSGNHTLTIRVERKGLYAGASQDRILRVVRAGCLIEIQAPARIILPTTMGVEGSVSSDLGPVAGADVTLSLGKAFTAVRTSEDGRFSTPLHLPLDLALVGFHRLVVKVKPAEPWRAPAQAKTNLFVINPIQMGLISIVLLASAVVVIARLIGRRKGEAETVEAKPSLEKTPELPHQLEREVRFEGITSRILEAYLKAMRLVEDATEVSMKPNQTLREFLVDTAVPLNGGVEAFAELTTSAERALYSPYVIDVEEATRAEELAIRVEEVLTRGAA